MSLYKDTLTITDSVDEMKVDLAWISLDLRMSQNTSFSMSASIDLGASHNFMSIEAWQSLPQGAMITTNATMRSIDGALTKLIEHITLNVAVAKNMLHVCFYVMPVGTLEEHMVLGQTWCCQVNY